MGRECEGGGSIGEMGRECEGGGSEKDAGFTEGKGRQRRRLAGFA
jgi:hypothetical protein